MRRRCATRNSGTAEPFGRFLYLDFLKLWRSTHAPGILVGAGRGRLADRLHDPDLPYISALFLREIERINLASAIGTVLVVAGVVATALVH